MSESRRMSRRDVLRFLSPGRRSGEGDSGGCGAAAGSGASVPRSCGSGGCGCAEPALPPAPGAGRCGSGGCGCAEPTPPPAPAAGRCGSGECGCAEDPHPPGSPAAFSAPIGSPSEGRASGGTILDKPVDRRHAVGMLAGAVAAGSQAASACSPLVGEERREAKLLEWEEYFKGNFRLMTDEEKAETIRRLERLAKLRQGVDVTIRATDARPGVVYGYAFNISKCKGYRNCVDACIQENNLDRRSGTQYIRIFEMENGSSIDDLDHGDATFQHMVPAEGHFYLGTQCFQCANPPCVEVCPVAATWQEPDGITVVDYDWCIGCRYCIAACPYWARRFNWGEPIVPAAEVNPNQHYLGNRARKKGVVEKCTFCIQRVRQDRLPACVEACPTGARVFGNLLDPDSEIRWVIQNKKVFRFKEELNTEPRFWYFMD